jgi:hypothetical protein
MEPSIFHACVIVRILGTDVPVIESAGPWSRYGPDRKMAPIVTNFPAAIEILCQDQAHDASIFVISLGGT